MNKHLPGIKLESWLVSAGRPSEPGAPLNAPLVPASNFIIGKGREYARDDGTSTWESLEEVVGGLESGKAVAFASGMGAIAAIFDQLRAGAHVALPDDCYQGVAGLVAAGAARKRWSVERINVDDTAGWIRACAVADLVWLESPSNPLLTVADLEAICAAPRKAGSLLAVDNTLATPLNQRPLDFGATVSLTSATKFIGGHSDLLAGVATTRDEVVWKALKKTRELTGAHARHLGSLPRRSWRENAGYSIGARPTERNDPRRAASETSTCHSGPISGAALTYNACDGQTGPQGLRNHHFL
jgi:cystathionine gamma-synthase